MHKEDRFQNDLSTTYDYDGRFMGEKRRKRPRCILILEYFSKYGRESMELDIGRDSSLLSIARNSSSNEFIRIDLW